MHLRFVSTIALVVSLAGLTGCSGGSSASGTTSGAALSCTGSTNALCLLSCNLGCSATGCQISEIAQNANIVLNFSRDVDPRTVSESTIQFRTASGQVPVGDFLVRGSVVEFVPRVLIVGGQSFFGFRAGETYTMRLPGGSGETNSVRSTAGDPLKSTLSCTLNVTRGIIDLNGVPPSARITSPTATTNVPRNLPIQLEFNELLDVTPFVGTAGSSSPIIYAVRRTREVGGVRECSPNSQPQVLGGAPTVVLDAARSVTRVTFQPISTLPGNTCVEVTVTDRVRDLSGKPAQSQVFQFITEAAQLQQQQFVENFDDDAHLDRDASAGTWANGQAVFGAIGGDGRHGTFRLDLGVPDAAPGPDGRLVYTFNTDNTIIPGSNTTTGSPIAVTDGNFYFDQMSVPSNVRLKFIGSNPPRFHVRGRLEIFGIIDVKGIDQPFYDPSTANPAVGFISPGQDGGLGGVFGGRGGRGGNESTGLTGALGGGIFGLPGQDCNVPSGHAYFAQRIGTGGRGSSPFPISGLNTDLSFAATTVAYCVQAAAGGGGGGYFATGGLGRVISNSMPEDNPAFGTFNVPPKRAFLGPDSTLAVDTTAWVTPAVVKIQNAATAPTATAFVYGVNAAGELAVGLVTGTWAIGSPVFNAATAAQVATTTAAVATNQGKPFPILPIPAGTKSSTHFLVGGSGGGGGGSQATFALRVSSATTPIAWAAGHGGAGGGGAIQFSAGDLLRVSAGGQILAKGGACPTAPFTPASNSQATPGGGGSGGSILLQSGRISDVLGLIDVRGGAGGVINRSSLQGPPAGASVNSEGGAGANGFARLEFPGNPLPTSMPGAQPAATANNVATLVEVDDQSGFRSTFISTGQPFGPDFVRYEITAIVDGVPTVFSDDPTVGAPARFGAPWLAPIEIRLQAATMDLVTNQVDANSIRPWRINVASGNDPSLADDGLNAFRFQIVIDRSRGQQVVIDQVKVVYRV